MSGSTLRARLEAGRAQLARELHGRRWLSEPGAAAGGFELEDLASIPGEPDLFVLALLRFPAPGKRYFVPLRVSLADGEDLALREASYDPGLLSALVGCMSEERTLVTEQRRSIQCRAAKGLERVVSAADSQPPWARPFQEGMSSNCLSELRHGARRSVCKLYKHLGPDSGNELRAMELLAGTGLVPELLGSVLYHGEGGVQPLGMLTAMVEGEPVYLTLSRHLKALCAEVVRNPAEAGALTRSDLAALEPLCRGVGEHLLRFHQHLNQGVARTGAGRRAFQYSRFLDAHQERWRRLHSLVAQDGAMPETLRARVLERLQHLAQEVLSPARLRHLPSLPATIPHGDLHLSHVLLVPEAGGASHFRILDVSPRSLDEQSPAFLTQTVQQDVLSLGRAIQYFAFDEMMDGIKDVLGLSQLEATRRVLEHPERLPPPSGALLHLLSAWSQGLFGSIERAYLKALHREDFLDTPPACAQLFYACRLLQELEYNYSHGREFFKYCDFYYLLQLKVAGQASPPRDDPSCTSSNVI